MDLADLLRPHQVAKLLGVTTQRIRQLADSGQLPVVWVGDLRFFEPEAVERLRREREAAGLPRKRPGHVQQP
ncbi:MAG: helix-turn-helix domain-containing protein [Armatimonadota bacterium]|nr:helix-turn-helix domain-containing protein [Armatimonadota bacterium]